MLCGFIIRSTTGEKQLLLSRKEQVIVEDWLAQMIDEQPFICNTREGIYLFLAREKCTVKLHQTLEAYINAIIHVPIQLVNCSHRPHFFLKEVERILQDNTTSSLAWKNFISSFLGQLKPFLGDSKPVYSLFKTFVGIIKFKGNQAQLDYLKHRMNLHRQRVSLAGLFLD